MEASGSDGDLGALPLCLCLQTTSFMDALETGGVAITTSWGASDDTALGCADIVQDSISRSDVDVRRELYNSILLTGEALCLMRLVAGRLWDLP